MAIRLSDTDSDVSAPPAAATVVPLPTGESPADRREAPYRAHRAAIETRLATAATAPQRDLPGLYLAVTREALDTIAEEPREPVLLNYAGLGLHELGAREAAAELFEAALRLDPQLPYAARNLGQSRARKGPRPTLPPAVLAQLRGLEEAGRRVAAKAQPVTGLTLSLCMIVRDEEAMLPRSLA